MIRRLLNTTVFRLSLIYALLFSLVAAGAMVSIYWITENHITRQTDARLQLEADILLNRYGVYNTEALLSDIRRHNQRADLTQGDRFYSYVLLKRREYDMLSEFEAEYTTADGRQLFATRALNQTINFSMTPNQEQPARILITLLPDNYQLLVATDMSEQRALLNEVFNSMLLAILVIFTLAGIGGYLMGDGVLRRIDSVRQTAGEIMDGDLSQRMRVTKRNDEFDRLSIVLNSMLRKIEQLMQAKREVTDNLAHDLRNPLNRLRNRLESNQFRDPDSTDFQQLNQDAIQDVDELIKTFNALLGIAQAESGVQRDDWQLLDLSQLIADLGELYEVVAEEKNIHFSHHAPSELTLFGNRQLLAQALTNLLDNAVKYTPAHGQIELMAAADGDGIQIQINDSGIGIPHDQYEQVFERFVRLDNARSSPGNGLGLSLVKAVIDMHEGQIKLADNQPGLRLSLHFLTPSGEH